jgi:hypothetical protein
MIKVEWRKGRVTMRMTLGDGEAMDAAMRPESAIALANALNDAGSRAWTGAFAIPVVSVTEEEAR